ncbi:MAG: FlgO family outer membrane protein [Gammaproteobacteria bacterium]|nr:FlgO family outer membrane protein [Gammaproteobacteria bacterium]
MRIIQELKRRNVFRVAAAYLAGAWLLIEVAQTLFPLYGFSDAAVRLIVALLSIGFPITLILSWVFELTPEGFKLEKDIDRSVALDPHVGKRLDRIIIVLLVLSLGYFAFDKFVIAPSREAQLVQATTEAVTEQISESRKSQLTDKSIAVLPFVNFSPSPEDEYFSDGLTEELIDVLAKVEGLHVTARTSAFSFKGTSQDIRNIGQQLNVRTVLEGSVRRDQDQIRVTAQLINVEDGFHLWSESYTYKLENVLALQESIAKAIVGALRIQLTPEVTQLFSKSTAVNPKAYDLYLKGRYYWAHISKDGFRQSIAAFQQSIATDPGYAPPHAGLATVYSFMGYFGIIPPRQAYPLSIKEAETALSLDPESSEALVARGMASMVLEWDWDHAREDLSRALELSPNYSQAHWAWAEYLAVTDPPKALDSALKALSLDPLSLPIMNSVAFKYLMQGMYSEALRIDDEMIAMDPNFIPAYWNQGISHMLHGRFDIAIEKFRYSVEHSGHMPPTLAMLAYAYAKSGDDTHALAILDELKSLGEESRQGYAPPLLIAYVYEGLGRTADALDWLERAMDERDGWLVYLNTFPRFESLRSEARFKDILRRLQLPETDHNQAWQH